MRCVGYFFQTLVCIYISVVYVSAEMSCYQEELGEAEILHCPSYDAYDPELGYCCNNNGHVSCCSYDDYYERHFGPSVGTIIALIVSHTILAILVVFWCRRNSNCNWCSSQKELV